MTGGNIDNSKTAVFLLDLDNVYAQYAATAKKTARLFADEAVAGSVARHEVLDELAGLQHTLAWMIAEHPRNDLAALKYKAKVIEDYCCEQDSPSDVCAMALARGIERMAMAVPDSCPLP